MTPPRRLISVGALVLSVAAAVLPLHAGASTTGDPFLGKELYVDPYSNAARTAASLRATDPSDAAQLDKIAAQSQADWFGDWNPTSTVQATVAARTKTIRAAGAMPVYVAYDIPERDCNGYSGGGASSPSAYKSWIRNFAAGVGSGAAAVIVEPDALAQLGCLSATDQSTRLSLLRYAVKTLTSYRGVAVYLDAGNSGWIPAATMAQRLKDADVVDARGFSLNVSNYDWTSSETTYGRSISSRIGWKRFVIDTSRNGLGPDGQWCNAPGRALGARPTASTSDNLADAYLWIKRPGESDGTCNGGPAAGTWWTDYAIGLAERAAY